ncbi:MAG: hypothetical protein ACYCSX_17910 [Acidimicrobiales bacterium]
MTSARTPAVEGLPSPMPAGTYDVIVASADFEETSSGSLKCRIDFTVATGPHAGRTVRSHLVCRPEVPNSVGYFFAQMRALGLSSADFAALSVDAPGSSIGRALVGRRAHITVAPTPPPPAVLEGRAGVAVDLLPGL